jgi:hypothetical protein
VLFHELVANGRNSGWNLTESFSNGEGTYMSSLGAFVTGAPYVDEAIALKQGRLGRSLGRPAIRPAIARELIDEIRDGSVLYSWHPSISGALLR